MEVSDRGGKPHELTANNLGWLYWPFFLRDGRHFLYLSNRGSKPETGIYLASVDHPLGKKVLSVTSRVEATRGDVLYFVRDGVLLRQKLDVDRGVMAGEASTIAESAFGIWVTGAGNFSVSATGSVIAYQRAPLATQLVVRDMEGRETSRLGSPIPLRSFRLSPDGRRLALDLFESTTGSSDVWLFDRTRNVSSRLTTIRGGAYAPIWSRDGAELVASCTLKEKETDAPQLSRLSLSNPQPRPLAHDDGPEYATDFTRDGAGVIFTVDRGRQSDIEMLSMTGDGKRTVLESSEFNERGGALSPDGRWLAFTSESSGTPEIYVRRFGAPGEAIRISESGGGEAHWSRDGHSLFYVSTAGMLTRVPVTPGENLAIEPPASLFHISSSGMMELQEFGSSHYDLDPDGQHIIVREIPAGYDEAPVTVIISAEEPHK